MRWGLVPFWAKDIRVGFANINAKAEARALRPHRAELGHRQQGERAQRFLGVHDLGSKRQAPLPPQCIPQAADYPALKRAVREQQNLFNASVVLIEDKASGTQLIQELVAEGGHGVTRYQPTGDKTMRMHAQTAMIENGFVHIPESAPWLAEYLHEMTVFPNGKHDDQADSTAQFLDWYKAPFPGQYIFEYYRRLAEADSHFDPRLRACSSPFHYARQSCPGMPNMRSIMLITEPP